MMFMGIGAGGEIRVHRFLPVSYNIESYFPDKKGHRRCLSAVRNAEGKADR